MELWTDDPIDSGRPASAEERADCLRMLWTILAVALAEWVLIIALRL